MRQRAQIQEHLAWLDREIAAAEGVPALPPPTNRPPQAPAAPASTAVSAPSEAEKILDQFQQDATALKTDARRGCLMVFFIAMGLLILGGIVGYYFYGRHLGRWW